MSGDILERDERGRILKKSLSTDEARAMATKRHAKSVVAKKDDVLALIQEAGYSTIEDAPTALRIVCEELADKGSRSIAAVVQYRQLTQTQGDSTSKAKVKRGERCPTCNQHVLLGMELNNEGVDLLVKLLNSRDVKTGGYRFWKEKEFPRAR